MTQPRVLQSVASRTFCVNFFTYPAERLLAAPPDIPAHTCVKEGRWLISCAARAPSSDAGKKSARDAAGRRRVAGGESTEHRGQVHVAGAASGDRSRRAIQTAHGARHRLRGRRLPDPSATFRRCRRTPSRTHALRGWPSLKNCFDTTLLMGCAV